VEKGRAFQAEGTEYVMPPRWDGLGVCSGQMEGRNGHKLRVLLLEGRARLAQRGQGRKRTKRRLSFGRASRLLCRERALQPEWSGLEGGDSLHLQ
jgi:hypothetical protein